jgi:hypothetical protein
VYRKKLVVNRGIMNILKARLPLKIKFFCKSVMTRFNQLNNLRNAIGPDPLNANFVEK